jgi:hypothetical protein
MHSQPKARAPRGSSTRRQPKAKGKGSPGGKMTHRLTKPKGY